MSLGEIEKVRKVSRAANKGPWVDWWEEMARKTVLRRLSKRLPMSTDLDDLIRRDDALYDFGKRGADGQVDRMFKPVENPLLDTIEHESVQEGEASGEAQPAAEVIEGEAAASGAQVEEGAGQQPASAPQVDRQSSDYALGYEGGIQNLRKGLTAEVKADPVRLANWEAGQAAGRAEAARERGEA